MGLRNFVIPALLLGCAASAQTAAPASSTFLLRLLHVNMSQGKGASECVIVYPDGRYERERIPYAFNMPQATEVARGTLAAGEVEKLRQVLAEPALAGFAAREEMARGNDVESMTAVVPRQNGRQVFTVSRTDTDKMPAEAAPLLDWFKALPQPSFALPQAEEHLNGCRPPASTAK